MTLKTAVIDRYSMEAYISMAYAEDLLSATKKTDGVFEAICKKPVDYHVRQQVLEQLVITPTLAFHCCSDFIWDALDGSVMDDGLIVNIDDPKPELPAQVESLSLEIITGLIRASGQDIPPSQFGPLADAALAAAKEEDEYVKQSGKKPPNLMSKQFIDIFNKASLDIPHKYTEKEYDAQRKRNDLYNAFAPISSALSEYLAVVQSAEKHNMLAKTPQFSDAGQTQVSNPQFAPGTQSEELILFRIVAEQLGKTTYRPTIKGSLELAQNPATVALRERLQLWQNELPRGDESQLKAIQKEIKQAHNSISRLSGVQTIGTITTWLSVPVGVAEMMLALPPVLGFTIGVAGKVSSAKAMAVTRKHKWAMFGNTV